MLIWPPLHKHAYQTLLKQKTVIYTIKIQKIVTVP